MVRPLEGIRVIDLGRFVSAPFCGMLLADMGAEVIKVERPGKGEDARSIGPFMNSESLYVPTFNRNKKGITLQLRSQEGMEMLKKLIAKSDVMIENYRPGTISKMGLGYEQVRVINPRLILASISGFGQTGPDALKPAFDPVAQAVGGLYSVTGTKDSGPLGAGTVISDLTTGLYTAYAILAAVLQREKTGKGQYIDISMTDCMVSFMHTYIANFSANGVVPPRHGNRDLLSAPADCYKTGDGYVVMHAGEDKTYKLLKKIIGDPRMENSKFDTHQGRVDFQDELEGYVQAWFAERTAAEAETALVEGGVIAAAVNDLPRLFASRQLKDRNMLVEMEVPGAGMCTFQGSPLHMSEAAVSYQRAPMVGEHNREILTNLLGMAPEMVEQFRRTGVI